MDTQDAAEHYADALRSFAEEVNYNPESISVKRPDELDGRYGDCWKVIWETGSFRLMGEEIDTGYGFIQLTEFGLDPEVAREFVFQPYNAAVVCVYD